MGQSLVYLQEPNKEVEHEEGKNQFLKYAAGSMQGWRLNMVSLLLNNSFYRRTLTWLN